MVIRSGTTEAPVSVGRGVMLGAMRAFLIPRDRPLFYLTRNIGSAAVRRGMRQGYLQRIYRGAYVPVIPGESRWQHKERIALARAMAIHDMAEHPCVISHQTAALIHGCRIWQLDDRTHTWQVMRTNMRPEPVRRRHLLRAPLPREDITVVRDVRVTSLERTIIDCARYLHPGEALVIADSAFRMLLNPERTAREEVEEELAVLRRRLIRRVRQIGGHWVRRAIAVLELASPWSESAYESMVRWVAVSRGLPQPELQYELSTRLGVFYVDLAWFFTGDDGLRWCLAVEVDGAMKYRHGDSTDRDLADMRVLRQEKQREDAIRELPGVRVLRIDTSEVHNSDQLFARILGALPNTMGTRLHPVQDLMAVSDPRS